MLEAVGDARMRGRPGNILFAATMGRAVDLPGEIAEHQAVSAYTQIPPLAQLGAGTDNLAPAVAVGAAAPVLEGSDVQPNELVPMKGKVDELELFEFEQSCDSLEAGHGSDGG